MTPEQGWPRFLQDLEDVERTWRNVRVTIPDAKDYVRWMPYPIGRFSMFLSDAVAVAPGLDFLDVGAGPGTKCLLAAQLFDLQAGGIEVCPEYVQAARELGAQVIECNARGYGGWDTHDIVYLNSPVQDTRFERHVMDMIRPGAVLITVNGMTRPPAADW
jgi:SAM-dependent methyltransferase